MRTLCLTIMITALFCFAAGCESTHNNTDRTSISGMDGYGPTTSGLETKQNSTSAYDRELGMSSGHNVRITGGKPIENRFRRPARERDVTDEFFDDIGDGANSIGRGLKETGDFLFGWLPF